MMIHSHSAVAAMAVLLLAACNQAGDSEPQRAATTSLTAHATQRMAFDIVGADTLSDSVRIVQVIPEPDGDGVLAFFADPARRVTAGLAIVDRKTARPQLLWPDSVTAAWWSGPHTVAFTTTTGKGIRLVVDIHAATLNIADTTTTGLGAPPGPASVDSSVAKRARAFTDSSHQQLDGVTRTSVLTYFVTRVVPSPDGSMAAFHSVARDSAGMLTNPSWSVLDRTSGAVAALDAITGSAAELPAQAAAWSGNRVFFYAKGRAIWEAEVQRSSSPPGA